MSMPDTHTAIENDPTQPHAENRREKHVGQEALWAALVLLVVLGVGKHISGWLPGGMSTVFSVTLIFQIAVPLELLQRRGHRPEHYGIHAHGLIFGTVAAVRRILLVFYRRYPWQKRSMMLGRPRGKFRPIYRWLGHNSAHIRWQSEEIRADFAAALRAALWSLPLFTVGYIAFLLLFYGANIQQLRWAWHLPAQYHSIYELILQHFLLVGLAEELFYRGYVERCLLQKWPKERTILGPLQIPWGRAVVLSNVLFALGHFVGEYRVGRLGPFFPAFLFSALVRRRQSILPAILYHGTANVFSALLTAGISIHP